jgi:HEAT repeat protein
MRNLGSVRHRQSWPLLVQALDDRHPDIQLVALRALAALGALESFPLLRERLHAVIQGKSTSPPLQVLQAAMVSFDLKCLPALLPSLRHPDRNVRLHATEILLTIVRREAARMPSHAVTSSLLTPEIEDLLASELAVDTRAAVRARAAEVVVFLGDPRATPMLREFLRDQHWFVRLRAVQALDYWRPAVAPLHLDLRECLSDPHWRVREAAIRALISLGQQGKRQIYEHFLTSQDRASCEQIVEVIERSGLMSALVEEYSSGTKGVDALMVEQLASETAPLGLSGVLRTVNSETRQKFLDRFLPCAEAKLRFLGDTQFDMELPISRQQVLDFPSYMAA